MATQYQLQKSIGSNFEPFWKILIASFDSCTALETFVGEQLGNEVVNSINWDGATRNVAFNLISASEREGFFDKLVSALHEEQPGNTELSALIAAMVAAGVLTIVP